MVENGSEAMWLFGPDSIVTYASPSTRHILGIGPAEVVGTGSALADLRAQRPRHAVHAAVVGLPVAPSAAAVSASAWTTIADFGRS